MGIHSSWTKKAALTVMSGALVVAFAPAVAAPVAAVSGGAFQAVAYAEGETESTVVEISTADELKAVATAVNNGTDSYAGKTVKLMNDINLSGKEWTPIGTGYFKSDAAGQQAFAGTFDGDNHTISGLVVSQSQNEKDQTVSDQEKAKTAGNNYKYNEDFKYAAKGLFGYVTGTVQNLKIDGAKITGWNAEGAAVGKLGDGGKVSGVTVTNSKIAGEFENAGAVVGMGGSGTSITDCSVDNCTVQIPVSGVATSENQNGAGGVAGRTQGGTTTFTRNKVTNTKVSAYRKAAGLVGYIISPSSVDLENNNVSADITVDKSATNKGGNPYSGVLTAEIQGSSNTNRAYETDGENNSVSFTWYTQDSSTKNWSPVTDTTSTTLVSPTTTGSTITGSKQSTTNAESIVNDQNQTIEQLRSALRSAESSLASESAYSSGLATQLAQAQKDLKAAQDAAAAAKTQSDTDLKDANDKLATAQQSITDLQEQLKDSQDATSAAQAASDANFSALTVKSFKVTPKNGKKVTIAWKAPKGTTGLKYQVQYHKKGADKWTSKKTSKTSYTVKKLKAGKKYAFKVRAYKKAGDKTVYTDYEKSGYVTALK